jgi:hypothetical protein
MNSSPSIMSRTGDGKAFYYPSQDGLTGLRHAPIASHGSTLFVHIPKCGGTSILESIRAAFPESDRLELNGDQFTNKDQIAARVADRLPHASIVYGHRVFAGLGRHMRQPVRLVTVMRDPIERAISQYNYILTRPTERQIVHNALTPDHVRVPFADWLQEFPPAANHIVWMLSQVLGDGPTVFDFSLRVGTEEARLVSERLTLLTNVYFFEQSGVDAAIETLTGLPPRRENAHLRRFVDPADPLVREAAALACTLDRAVYTQAQQTFGTAPPPRPHELSVPMTPSPHSE